MIARTKLPGSVLVVPYGTGIGDMVNMAPLLAAIVAANPEGRVSLLCDASLSWLLPPGVQPVASVHGVRPWRRLRAGSPAGRILSHLSVPVAGGLMGPLVGPTMARWMTGYLRRQEFPVVINLLAMLTALDGAGDRWTPGPWQPERRHVVDLLAEGLEARGIPLPADRRAPRLELEAARLGPRPVALVNANAGSTLKQAPAELWCEILSGLDGLGFECLLVEGPGVTSDPRLQAVVPGIRPVRSGLRELAGFIAGAAVVISPDTGILHLAAAVGTPYVGLFGSTDPAFSGPYLRRGGEVVEARFDHPPVCRSCWKAQMLPAARCPLFGPSSCLSRIDSQAVMGAVRRVTT